VSAQRASDGTRRDLDRTDEGFSLIEILVSLIIVAVVAGGMATMYGLSVRANDVNATNVQLLNSARAKIEQIVSIPYRQVGIRAAVGSSIGEGYFVVDSIAGPVYDVVGGDSVLSDTVTLPDGSLITRTVTIVAVDDAADGIGANDFDQVKEPNTDTILDYKLLTVTTRATRQGATLTQTLSTVLQGSLAVEIEGGTGVDADGATPPSKVKTVKGKSPGKTPDPPAEGPSAWVEGQEDPTTPTEPCDIDDPGKSAGKGKDGVSKQSGC
jgi:prepilin-type N-terminal cleavage/methylation domain-containing protein